MKNGKARSVTGVQTADNSRGSLGPERRWGMEFMETPDADPVLLEGCLDNLNRLNQMPGGHCLTMRAVGDLLETNSLSDRRDMFRSSLSRAYRRIASPNCRRPSSEGMNRGGLELLDLACGGASLARKMNHWTACRGIHTSILATDGGSEIVHSAERATNEASEANISFAVADARSLPFEDDSFDIATLSLALHHFEPREAVSVLAEMRRVSRLGFVVNDLVRSWTGILGSRVLLPLLFKNAYTIHDGVVSARRAYTKSEFCSLVQAAGGRYVHFRGIPGYRTAMVVQT